MVVLVDGLQTHSLQIRRDHWHDFDVGLGHFEWTIKIQSLIFQMILNCFFFFASVENLFLYSLANNKYSLLIYKFTGVCGEPKQAKVSAWHLVQEQG